MDEHQDITATSGKALAQWRKRRAVELALSGWSYDARKTLGIAIAAPLGMWFRRLFRRILLTILSTTEVLSWRGWTRCCHLIGKTPQLTVQHARPICVSR